MWNKPELSNKTAPAVCTDCADKITYAMMPVSGSKISSHHWDFVIELEYHGFVKLSIHQGNPTAISSALWTLCRHMSPTATT